MAIQDQLGKMIGPLPLGAWIAIVGGGLGFAMYSQRSAPIEEVADTEPGRDTSLDSGVGMGGSGQWIDITPVAPQPTPTTIVTNDDWGREALGKLIALGHDPAMSSQAVGNYLSGNLSAKDVQQWALVRIALQQLGSPPLPVVSPGGAPSTPRPTPTTPVVTPPVQQPGGYVYHTVKPGETIASIAKAYNTTPFDIWGFNNAAGNRQGPMTSQTSIRVGWVLRIMRNRKTTPPKPATTPAPKAPVKKPTTPAKPAPKPQVIYHTVKRGENLTGIAKKYGTTWQKVFGLNNNDGTARGPIRNPNHIEAGWRIRVK